MARITKREKSKYWIACFTNRDVRQLKRSTKTTDRNQAMQIAAELERVETQAKRGNLTSMQLRKTLNDLAEKVTGDTLIAPSVGGLPRRMARRDRGQELGLQWTAQNWFNLFSVLGILGSFWFSIITFRASTKTQRITSCPTVKYPTVKLDPTANSAD